MCAAPMHATPHYQVKPCELIHVPSNELIASAMKVQSLDMCSSAQLKHTRPPRPGLSDMQL